MSPREAAKKLRRAHKFHAVNVTNGTSERADLRSGSHSRARAEAMARKREREGFTVRLETFLRT